MATYKISSTGAPGTLPSVFTTTPFGVAFGSDTAASADTLIVDHGAFLIATGGLSIGAALTNTLAWTATVNGTVIGDAAGIYLFSDNAATSNITIGAEGQIGGTTLGIAADSPTTIKNAGVINASGGIGIRTSLAGAHTITNTGTISGSTFSIQDIDGLGNDKVTNSGTLNGGVKLGDGINALTNSGTIKGTVNGGNDADTIINSNMIVVGVILGDGLNKLTNSGTIGGGVIGGSGVDTIINSKTINGTVDLGDGLNKLTNSGTIGGDVIGGSGVDTIINSKTINGTVDLGAGNDVFTNTGSVDGVINLGDGDDKFTGGNTAEVVPDTNGSDTIKLGGGNDFYRATGAAAGLDGTDIVDGGAGLDTYYAGDAGAGGSVFINLDTIAHDLSPLFPGSLPVAAKTATGTDVAGGFKDTITGFENATGGFLNDFIHGSGAANRLDGRDGLDFLFGYAGNDTLEGGAGSDNLIGGAGKDVLTGEGEADTFSFVSTKDSGITKATRDVITDFLADGTGGELIDLSFIDANTKVAGDQAFNFIGTNVLTGFSGAAGELRATWSANGQIIEGDVNGDKKADFSFEIADPTHAITLSLTNGDDFIL